MEGNKAWRDLWCRILRELDHAAGCFEVGYKGAVLCVLLLALQVQCGVLLGSCNAGCYWGLAGWGKAVIVICSSIQQGMANAAA
jgi:hypothetical protein